MSRPSGARSAAGRPSSSAERTSRARAWSSCEAGGSVWMWRSLMRTTPTGSETWKPASRPRPTMNSVEPPPMSITTVGSLGAARPDMAPRKEGWASSSPRGKLRAVRRVAHSGGEHGHVRGAVVRVDRLTVFPQPREHAIGGLLREAALGVHAGAEARDLRAPQHFGHRAGDLLHIGDEQPRGVRPYVHHRHAHSEDARGARSPRRYGRATSREPALWRVVC